VVEYNTSTNPTENGVVKDTSGNGAHGRLFNGAYYDPTKKALVFDGTDDTIRGTQNIGTGEKVLTMAMWIKRSAAVNTYDYVCTIGTSTSSQMAGFAINSNKFNFTKYGAQTLSTTTINNGQWYHVVGVYKGGNWDTTNTEIYVNGVKETITGGTTSALNLTGNQITFGDSTVYDGTSSFNGSISNFKLYDVAITADEVKRLYDMGRCDEGHHVVNFSKTRVGIGLGDGEAPRAELDVRGSAFASKYFGGLTTFLTGDYTSTAITSFTSAGQTIAMIEYTFDVPQEYHLLGRANLESQVMIKWCGEIEHPWNFMFYIDLYHSGLSTAVKSAVNTDSSSSRSNGAGVPVVNHHADYGSTLESAMIGSRIYIPNCDVSSGSTITVKLVGRRGNYGTSATVYTNRTKNDNDSLDYERGITNFFMALKVV